MSTIFIQTVHYFSDWGWRKGVSEKDFMGKIDFERWPRCNEQRHRWPLLIFCSSINDGLDISFTAPGHFLNNKEFLLVHWIYIHSYRVDCRKCAKKWPEKHRKWDFLARNEGINSSLKCAQTFACTRVRMHILMHTCARMDVFIIKTNAIKNLSYKAPISYNE